MRARNEITEVEKEVFEHIKQKVESFVAPLKKLSQALSYLDALGSLAHVAYTSSYTRPLFNDAYELTILDGRHPVVEARLQNKFVANTVRLTEAESLWLITGPNMGGKSTFLRQVALITLMAHLGSFVPAKKADISLVDRIFTRIGAADNVAEGKSTFLVEMEETALICNQATRNSLVILDEVGRGTSTFDGLAIAQAVVEYIYTQVKARCLFATHYHELTVLCEQFPGIAAYYAASTRTPTGIVLLHKILPGVADGSFGLEVAKLACVPELLIQRAHTILEELMKTERAQTHRAAADTGELLAAKCHALEQRKQELEAYINQREKEYEPERMLAAELAQIDCEHLTAKQALDLLWRLKEHIRPSKS
jgi:DNA mismatch repair protein MutS